MNIISSVEEICLFSQKYKSANPQKSIAFVPTMGCIHEGHLSLIESAQRKSDHVIVSIFVNPIQFNQKEDFDKYPRTLERDKELLIKKGVNTLFSPDISDVFPSSFPQPLTQISIPSLQQGLCALGRPGHFEGVLFVVYKLFSWIQAHYAFFGLKDYQQYLCVKTMARELLPDIKVIGCETIRDATGLALSSRNERLSAKGKEEALIIYHTLQECQNEWKKNRDVSVKDLRKIIDNKLKKPTEQNIEYSDLYDPDTLEILKDELKPKKVLIAIAAWFRGIRLIDNTILDHG